jgi:CBS domain-containing protein
MLVKDLMKEDVVSVGAETPLSEVAALFQQRCISGAPVVDEEGVVLGVISQTDLMLARRTEPQLAARYHVEPEPLDGELSVTATEVERATAESVMTPGAIAVDEKTSVSAVAEAMIERHIHRMLVTRDGKLAGIVTTMDLLRALVGKTLPRKPAAKKPPERRHGKTAKKR